MLKNITKMGQLFAVEKHKAPLLFMTVKRIASFHFNISKLKKKLSDPFYPADPFYPTLT